MSKKSKGLKIVPRLNLASDEEVVASDDGITLEDTGVDVFPQGKAPETASEGTEYEEGGKGHHRIAGKKAQFFQVENPDNPPNYEQIAQQVRKAYRGQGKSLSDNDAFFFTPAEGSLPKGTKIAGTVHLPIDVLADIVRNATEIGARNATDVVFGVLRKAGYDLRPKQGSLADNFGKPGRTNIQAEIEDSHPPTRGMVDSVEFDKDDPKSLKALEFVCELPFDEIDSGPKVAEGRKIGPNAVPSKVVK